MPLILAIVLGVVQGLTEFLPVSSSGHLVMFQHYLEAALDAPKTPLAFDVFVHLATLIVTLVFLRRDILTVLSKLLDKGEDGKMVRKLVVLVVIGSIPAAVVGLGFKPFTRELD